jgi:hypothetical protein
VNRLAGETSPYLRQHAGNPVDWYPWGPEAFEAARSRDVPVLLSIGYSACHWCHVMAHESFEDDGTAAVMNAGYVCVKVDREERPDVDAIYMEAVQAVTGSGGWPMTVVMLPDGRPFFGGTYFPRIQFLDVLDQIRAAWKDRRPEIEAAADHLAEAVRAGTALPRAGAGATSAATSAGNDLSEAVDALLSRFDAEWGGIGRAPKFPQPTMLELLLLAAGRAGRTDAMAAARTTLDAMAAGGIYDHLGGGFARYSTDRQWLVPHFEKMLYDNALLTRVYLHAWQLTGDDRYRQVVTETIGYLLRPPARLAGVAFASAEDADSEGVEGRFYVWSAEEVQSVGGPEAAEWYGVTAHGNWEGHNILRRPLVAPLARPAPVEGGRQALFDRREHRVRPGLDDKVLTEWNAMAVAALAEAGAALQRPEWVAAAVATGDFLLGHLRGPDGRWLRSWQFGGGAGSNAGAASTNAGAASTNASGGQARHLAYASDYAWLVEAFTRLAEATGDARWIAQAATVADALVDLFLDVTSDTFNLTGRDAEALIARTVDVQDGALPSANSVATAALLRLGALTGEDRYTLAAEGVLAALGDAMSRVPLAFTGLVAAAEVARGGLQEVVVTGERPDLVHAVAARYLPGTVLAWGEPWSSPIWEGRTGADQAGRAFVCRNYACQAPTADVEVLATQLRS